MEEFLENIRDLLDTDMNLTGETHLHEIEDWDSLATVSFLAMVNVEYDKVLDKTEIKRDWTLKELYEYIIEK